MNTPASQSRPHLPQVTLVAVTSVNVAATLAALKANLAQIRFGACKLFTDAQVAALPKAIELVPIAPLNSARAYSDFMLRSLVDHLETPHCLVTQWDGHGVDSRRWRPEFLDYDYIGASWPQFADGYDVGNGGFSLRSRALMEACRNPVFRQSHPEDIAIGRHNRAWLETQGLRFAPRALADVFSAERAGNPSSSFGYHGVWHMPRLLGAEAFWDIYRGLDERAGIRPDFLGILGQLAVGRGGVSRALGMAWDRISDTLSVRKTGL
jgi:hypothetical protein